MDYTAATYGFPPQTPVGVGVAAPTQRMGTDDLKTGWRSLVDPANPLFWLGGLLAVTLGFAGVAGYVRLGPARVGVDIDRSS